MSIVAQYLVRSIESVEVNSSRSFVRVVAEVEFSVSSFDGGDVISLAYLQIAIVDIIASLPRNLQ